MSSNEANCSFRKTCIIQHRGSQGIRIRAHNQRIMSKCFFTDCERDGVFQCSRCKSVKYCCLEHQKLDWKSHKGVCAASSNITKPAPEIIASPQAEQTKGPTSTEGDKRHCRCMFCGEALVFGSEEEAIDHMRVCVALQEQLASKEQFTVPAMVKEKYTKK